MKTIMVEKVKERIIQQLAVMALNKKQSGSILLFVGAPGTGKTSIGQSIAVRFTVNTCVSVLVESVMKRKFEDTEEPT